MNSFEEQNRKENAPDAQAKPRAGALLPATNREVIIANKEIPSDVAVASDFINPVFVSLHYLSITFFCDPRSIVPLIMEKLAYELLADADNWDKCFINTNFKGRYYKSIYHGPYGMALYAYPNKGTHCHLEIKGEATEDIGQSRLLDFLHSLHQLSTPFSDDNLVIPINWQATRVDIAFDGVPFTPRDCYDAYLRGDIRCAANRKSWAWQSNEEGDTLYIGVRKSERYIRIYNRRGPTRVEIEYKGMYAEAIGSVLSFQESAIFHNSAISYLRMFVDFVEATTGGSITRATLLPWWKAFVGDIDRIALKIDRARTGNAAIRGWHQLDRMLPTLYTLMKGFGVSLDELCNGAEHRLTPKHLLKITEIQRALRIKCSFPSPS